MYHKGTGWGKLQISYVMQLNSQTPHMLVWYCRPFMLFRTWTIIFWNFESLVLFYFYLFICIYLYTIIFYIYIFFVFCFGWGVRRIPDCVMNPKKPCLLFPEPLILIWIIQSVRNSFQLNILWLWYSLSHISLWLKRTKKNNEPNNNGAL